MKSVKNLLGHRAAQVAMFVVLSLVGGAYFVNHARHTANDTSAPSITWLSRANVGSELSISQAADGSVTAAPATPVLLIECPHATCESTDLNLAAVSKQFDGKVKIVAIDPYEQKSLVQALDQSFLAPAVRQALTGTLAMRVAQSNATDATKVTAEDVQAVMANTQFQDNVKKVLASRALFKQYAPELAAMVAPVYPKFIVFAAKSGDVANAATSANVNTQDDLTAFVSATLASLDGTATATSSGAASSATDSTTAASDPSTAAPSNTSSTTPGATGSGK